MQTRWLPALLCAACLWLAACATVAPRPALLVQRDGVLGTSFEMQVTGGGASSARAVDAALLEIERLENQLSTWRDDSVLSAYNAGALDADALPHDVRAVLDLCEHWRAATSGAFSCRLGSLIAHWRKADAEDRLPDRTQLRKQARALAAMDVPAYGKLDPHSGLRFDVDGIAKGYILDRALEKARAAAPAAQGIRIDIGGDAVYWGEPEPGHAWQANVADPAHPIDNGAGIARIALRSQAMASSGHGSRGYQIGRRRFSHILVPRDGWPMSYAPSAIVIANDAASADALATALTVLPVKKGLALVDGIQGAAALIVGDSGISFASARWPALWMPMPGDAATPAQVLIDYEIPQPASRDRYRQPYLALWIEREDGHPVRQLHVLGDRARWLGELPRWWRHYGRNDPAAALGLARPTRAPGRYSLTWDGRDDMGRAQPPGTYVLRVEAAREFGGHEDIAVPFTLGDSALDSVRHGEREIGHIAIRHGER